jgi:hypothetical protein
MFVSKKVSVVVLVAMSVVLGGCMSTSRGEPGVGFNAEGHADALGIGVEGGIGANVHRAPAGAAMSSRQAQIPAATGSQGQEPCGPTLGAMQSGAAQTLLGMAEESNGETRHMTVNVSGNDSPGRAGYNCSAKANVGGNR